MQAQKDEGGGGGVTQGVVQGQGRQSQMLADGSQMQIDDGVGIAPIEVVVIEPAHLQAALRLLLAFIGHRELVGYHIAYDLHILNLACQRLWGLTLPQRGLEVSRLYHDRLYRRYPDAVIDLHLAAICQHLGLPPLPLHDALSDATAAALIFLRLHQGGPLAYPKV